MTFCVCAHELEEEIIAQKLGAFLLLHSFVSSFIVFNDISMQRRSIYSVGSPYDIHSCCFDVSCCFYCILHGSLRTMQTMMQPNEMFHLSLLLLLLLRLPLWINIGIGIPRTNTIYAHHIQETIAATREKMDDILKSIEMKRNHNSNWIEQKSIRIIFATFKLSTFLLKLTQKKSVFDCVYTK